jgi:hypothetical protein
MRLIILAGGQPASRVLVGERQGILEIQGRDSRHARTSNRDDAINREGGASDIFIDIFFADTLQDPYNPGYHTSADKLDVKHLTGMEIQVGVIYVSGSPTANDFEIWIDDVRFIK